jgi:hypothetical protein
MLGKYLSSKGVEFSHVDDQGRYFAKSPEGELKELNLEKVLAKVGVDPKKANIELNTPDEASDVSPISMADRAKLQLGNTKGQLAYLKGKFEDAAVHEENGLVVKHKGAWHKVDSDSMDPWELTKDVVEGAVTLVPSVAGSTLGALAGTLAAGPVGGIIGAGAGGAGAENGRIFLGRVAGTYKIEDPNEIAKDVGWEFLLNAAGQSLGAAVKPSLPHIVKAAKTVGQAPAAVREGIADLLGRTTGAGTTATLTMFDHADEVASQIAKTVKEAGGVTAAESAFKNASIEIADKVISGAQRKLSTRFGELVDDLVAKVPDSYSVDLGRLVQRAQDKLAAEGLGSLVEEVVAPKATGLLDAAGKPLLKEGLAGKKVFQFLSNKESLARITTGQEGTVLGKETISRLKDLVDVFNEYASSGVGKGKLGAKGLMELRRSVNEAADAALGEKPPAVLVRFVQKFRSAVTSEVGQEFTNLKLADDFAATSNLYERYGAAVSMANKLRNNAETGAESLLEKLLQPAGRREAEKGLAGDLFELLGKEGEVLKRNLHINESARAFSRRLPKVTLTTLTAGGAGAGAVATGAITPVAGAAIAAQASPRLVLREAQLAKKIYQYGTQATGMLKSLTPAARAEWLARPEAVDATIRTLLQAYDGEEQMTQELLNQSGVQ